MKIFKFMMMVLVVMCGLNSCSDDCNHDFIEYDYSKALVGTWTCLDEDFAEAMVIKADGSLEVTGLVDGEYFQSKGTIKVVNNKMIYKIDNGDEWEGRFEMTTGESFTMVFSEELDIRYTYRYCENDLSDEVVGMWVCNEGVAGMTIQSYQNDGKSIFTGFSLGANDYMTNMESTYNVVGDLMFQKTGDMHFVTRLTYVPNGTSLGDILHTTATIWVNDAYVTSSYSFLRVKQNLDLAGKAYDYSATYISNAKGADKDIPFLDTKFNFAHMDGSIIDKFLKSVLYNVQFPDAKTFQYNCLLEGQNVSLQLPMEVEGNKITIKMSSRHEAYRDVVVYAFQDVDGCQFHMYMPTASFEDFFSNLSLSILSASGQVDINNPVHVDAVYKEVADAIESINVSIVLKARE